MERRHCPRCNLLRPSVVDRQGYERCGVCAWTFGLDEVRPVVRELIPVVLPVEEPVPVVLPVEEPMLEVLPVQPIPDRPQAVTVTPVAAVGAKLAAPRTADGLNSHQMKFYQYLANTMEHYRAGLTWWSLTRDYLRMPFQVLVVGVGLYVAVLVLHRLLDAAAQHVGDWVHYAIYLVPVFPLLFGIIMRGFMAEQPVTLKSSESRFWLGGFESIFNATTQAHFGCLVVAVFISQLAVLSWTPNHGGLALTGDVEESAWLCLDTVLRSFFLAPACLGWQLGPPVEHGGLSTPLFWLFRLAYNGLTIFIVYDLYLKYKYRNFLQGAPPRSAGPLALAGWIEALCKDRQAWPRHFTAELVFLYLGAKYLRGEYALLHTFGRATRWTRWTRVYGSVTAFFVDASGERQML